MPRSLKVISCTVGQINCKTSPIARLTCAWVLSVLLVFDAEVTVMVPIVVIVPPLILRTVKIAFAVVTLPQ